MCARDQSSIFSTGGKFRPDYEFLLELHTLTLVARSYVLLVLPITMLNFSALVTHSAHRPQCVGSLLDCLTVAALMVTNEPDGSHMLRPVAAIVRVETRFLRVLCYHIQ